jgi:tetratricopeptide (TPR) repeat protein
MFVLRSIGILAIIALVSIALYAFDPFHAAQAIRQQAQRLADWWPGTTNAVSQSPSDTDRAERALAKNDPQLALEYVRQALATPGTDAATSYRLGNIAQRAGNDTVAVVAYARGESADSQYPWNYIALGQLSARLNRLAPADAQLRQAITLQPSMQFLHYDLAMVELAEHRPAGALRDFDAELALTHGFGPALSGRALAAAQLSHPRIAVHSVLSALPAPPAPSPTDSPSPTPPASPSPSPPSARPTAAPVRVAKGPHTIVVIPARLRLVSSSGQQATAQAQNPQPVQTPAESPSPAPTPAPTPMPPSVTSEARNYLLAVSRDLNFTRAIPDADPTMTTAELQARLRSALESGTSSVGNLMHIGASALLSGRLAIADRAFDAATRRAPGDWRGPYLLAIVARADGDDDRARALLEEAASRAQRPEVFTSLAILDLETGDQGAARQNAEHAVDLDPSYAPARFTDGMIALISSDNEAAERNLAAATNLSGAPARSSYYLRLVSAH